jgi:molecular chaperone DnaJ
MRDPRDPRAVLGLPLHATRGEAQRAFRRLAKQTHPDAGGNPADFRAVAGAWAVLAGVLPPDHDSGSVASPHVRAYEPSPSRVVWSEPRRRVNPAAAVDFNTVLQGAVARRAA